jgi:cytochrome c oxidase subunit III
MEISEARPKSLTSNPPYLGMILFLISEAFLFGALFWTYYYSKYQSPAWPPAGVEISPYLAIANTALLLCSSGAIWWGVRAFKKGNEKLLARGILITALLGFAFLGITFWEWTHESFRPWTNAYGSIFYTLTGFHALHVLGGVLLMLALLARTVKHRFTAHNYMPLEVGSLYWHFVDAVWLVVFVTLFIVR